MSPQILLLTLLPAQTEPPAELGAILAGIGEAVSGKAWNVLAGFILSALIVLADRFDVLQWVPAGAKKWVACAIAGVMAAAGGLVAGLDALTILGAAVSTALAAIGSHQLILARFDRGGGPK